MNKQEAIYTEEIDCQDCYKCVRHCPVKAIKIENHSASIMHEQCIFCGKCVSVCPAGAKKIRNDTQIARYLLKQNKPVILSLAPSYIVNFNHYTKEQLIYALKKLGFHLVSETAIGAEILSANIDHWMEKQKSGLFISSCCPSAVQLINKYYPEQNKNIIPFNTPAQIHASYLRETYGDVHVVFAGPCIAKKNELSYPNNQIDLALTFLELDELLETSGLRPEFLNPKGDEKFEPMEATDGKMYPMDGGMIKSISHKTKNSDVRFMSFSGLDNVTSILQNPPEVSNVKVFMEFLTCQGGCVNGPCTIKTKSIAQSNITVTNNYIETPQSHKKPTCSKNISQNFNFIKPVIKKKYSEILIKDALKNINKNSEADELNCGGCGYYTCRQFAIAILDGKAEPQMCVSYMRKMAQNKASVLLQKMPYGFVIVNENMKVLESNKLFARICGKDALLAYDAKPGLEGADICKITSFHRLFQNLLESGNDVLEKHIHFDRTVLHITVFTIQKHKQVCAIIENPDMGNINRDDLIELMQKVIRDNMITAQKVAGLLGENAADTECAINKILDSYCGGNYKERYVY